MTGRATAILVLLGGGEDDGWQAPELLEALARDAKRPMLVEGPQVTFNVTLASR
jgi:hypothetical protein